MNNSGFTADHSGTTNAGSDTIAAGKGSGRNRVIFANADAAATIWLRFGQPAAAGVAGNIAFAPLTRQIFDFGHDDEIHLFCASAVPYTLLTT